MFYRGEQFRKAFSKIGQLQCLIPGQITLKFWHSLPLPHVVPWIYVIAERLSLTHYAVVAIPSNRPNIKLIVQSSEGLEEFAFKLSEQLRSLKNYPETLLFC